MARFVVGDDRSQSTLFPERLEECQSAFKFIGFQFWL